MADDYITGHRPPETRDQLVSRLNAWAYFFDAPTANPPRKEGRRKRRHKLVEKVEQLDPELRRALVELLLGERTLVHSHGHSFAVKRAEEGWLVRELSPGSAEHTVTADATACSCEDCRFRGSTCKHMVALRNFT